MKALQYPIPRRA